MTRLAVAGNPRLAVDARELSRDGVSHEIAQPITDARGAQDALRRHVALNLNGTG